jgi:hypothetical protein
MDETKLLVNELNRKMKKPALLVASEVKNMEIAEAEALFYNTSPSKKAWGGDLRGLTRKT